MPGLLSWIDSELSELEAQHLRRRLMARDSPQGPTIKIDGKEHFNFASNDYLGLANDTRLGAAAMLSIEEDGFGAGASPLIVGRSTQHVRLEEQLAEFEGTEAALLFPSGYAANVGALTSLVGRGDAVFSDELNHASIIDGCRLSRAEIFVYPHNDAQALERLLSAHRAFRRRLIVTDSLFSMLGDFAPLEAIAASAQRHECMLVVDEAHATGVFGEHGSGLVEALGLSGQVHARVGTLSKALGGHGGFVCGDRRLIDWLANRARPYVFSTAAPSGAAAAALAALDIVRREPQRRKTLLARAARVRTAIAALGWNVGDGASQIVPVIVHAPQEALRLQAELRSRGMFVPAIRPPSVPFGASCLRISLSASHSEEMLAGLCLALGELR